MKLGATVSVLPTRDRSRAFPPSDRPAALPANTVKWASGASTVETPVSDMLVAPTDGEPDTCAVTIDAGWKIAIANLAPCGNVFSVVWSALEIAGIDKCTLILYNV